MDAEAATAVVESFTGGCGDTDIADFNPEQAGKRLAKRGHFRIDPGAQAFEGQGEVADPPVAQIPERELKVFFAVRDAFLAQSVGHRADHGATGHAADRIGHSVEYNIGVAVATEGGGVLKDQPTQNKGPVRLAFDEAVTVQTDACFDIHGLKLREKAFFLRGGGLRAVGSMDDIAHHIRAEIAADGAFGRFFRIRWPENLPNRCDSARAAQ